MNTENRARNGRCWPAALWLALPALAAGAFAVFRWGGAARDLIRTLMKMAVTGG